MVNKNIIDLFQEAKDIMVFTGAGMSTKSGIPDFRSKDGLYREDGYKDEPEDILSHHYFFKNPDVFYEFFFKSLYHPLAKPNRGHDILADWEYKNKNVQIVTQNIDGLHSDAGSKNVIEFHGTIKTSVCYNPKCRKKYTVEELAKRREENPHTFYVCSCDPIDVKPYIKPNVVLFDEAGEWLNPDGISQIRQDMWKADLLVVLGSSLKVAPFKNFIDFKPAQIPLVIINKERVPQEYLPNTFAIHADIVETLTEIDRHL